MLAPSTVTPEPPALLPGEEEQLQQSTMMAGAPDAVTPATHQPVRSRLGKKMIMFIWKKSILVLVVVMLCFFSH